MGSPPPMRGKVYKPLHQPHDERITPAYAGKSSAVNICLDMTRDHPRLCGEKLHDHTVRRNSEGSPPPMRGKARCKGFLHIFIGITPAYAGKSIRHHDVKVCYRDHPRLCGEKQLLSSVAMYGQGSPPPMRGKD